MSIASHYKSKRLNLKDAHAMQELWMKKLKPTLLMGMSSTRHAKRRIFGKELEDLEIMGILRYLQETMIQNFESKGRI